MLPKKNRLDKKEINEIKKKSLRLLQGKYFGLAFYPVKGERKFGIILSAKISKKAVERNRIKRLLFLVIEENPFEEEGWFLFLGKKPSTAAQKEDFEEEIKDFQLKLRQG